MKDEAQFIESGDHILLPIQKAMARMHAAQHAWGAQELEDTGGECIRRDVVRAVRAVVILNRSANEYLMVFGIGGPNPCRSSAVILPTWEQLR